MIRDIRSIRLKMLLLLHLMKAWYATCYAFPIEGHFTFRLVTQHALPSAYNRGVFEQVVAIAIGNNPRRGCSGS